MSVDYHAVLGVRRNATADEIRAAYRRAAKRAHSDLGGSSEAFLLVRTAVDVLLADLQAGGFAGVDRPYRAGDRASLDGDWVTVRVELTMIWGLTFEPITVFAPQKIGLSPFTEGRRLNAPAHDWLIRTVGPRGEVWDFHVDGSVARVLFRRADDARLFKLRFC
jgi:hypothetical protein